MEKYCAVMPVPIFIEDLAEEKKDGDEEKEEKPVNDTNPLWLRQPSDCTDEDYKDFYRKVFSDYREPLFHIHLRADYPLNFKGILYFPKITSEYESIEGQVKLYYNQVFVADNIKEVIPELPLIAPRCSRLSGAPAERVPQLSPEQRICYENRRAHHEKGSGQVKFHVHKRT